MEPIRINRSEVFNGRTALRAYAWLYHVVVPGEPYDFTGKGLEWARRIARKHRAEGQEIIETWRVTA